MAQYWYFTKHKTNKPMKNSTQTTVIIKALDMELKALIQADLENFKAARSSQKQHQAKQAA